jgi:hypothetical protein
MSPSIDYSAGLIKYYHDVVNQPPYLKTVEIDTRDLNFYVAGWEDDIYDSQISVNGVTSTWYSPFTINPNHTVLRNKWTLYKRKLNKTGHKFFSDSNKDDTGFIDGLGGITVPWLDSDNMLPDSKPIWFGSHIPMNLGFSEPVDTPVIRLRMPDGQLLGGDTIKVTTDDTSIIWTADLCFDTDNIFKKFEWEHKWVNLEIQAKDKNYHYYSQSETEVKGIGLDADPVSPAKREFISFNPDTYQWINYNSALTDTPSDCKGGTDTFHGFYLDNFKLFVKSLKLQYEWKENSFDTLYYAEWKFDTTTTPVSMKLNKSANTALRVNNDTYVLTIHFSESLVKDTIPYPGDTPVIEYGFKAPYNQYKIYDTQLVWDTTVFPYDTLKCTMPVVSSTFKVQSSRC